MTQRSPELDIPFIRSHFPSLKGEFVFLDNAGGSQTLKSVTDRITEYLLTSNVQLGASYRVSQLAAKRLREATEAVGTLINAADPKEVVMGSSSSMLIRILAISLGKMYAPGDEVIVSSADHEANISPWIELEKAGITVKTWEVNPETLEFDLETLDQLMTPKTKLVAFTHCSNILGTINPARQISDFVHERGAHVCIDGVAYAPHRLVDVQAVDADFYIYSFYKVYGPHHAVMYGKRALLEELPVFNHYFLSKSDIPYKLQPGNVNYELSYGMLGLVDYLEAVADHHHPNVHELDSRGKMGFAFDLFARHEEVLAERLLQYLDAHPKISVIGSSKADQYERVPTIAFTVEGRKSDAITRAVDSHNIGLRHGDFYAKKLVASLGLGDQNGVVRASMVHYNSLEEIDRLTRALDEII